MNIGFRGLRAKCHLKSANKDMNKDLGKGLQKFKQRIRWGT